MSRDSVPGAIETDNIPMAGAAFVWSETDSVVSIALPRPLELATGADPARVDATCYSYRVSEAALDAAGQPIEPGSVGFCTARHINQLLPPVLDRDSSGNFRSDGSYGDGTCAQLGNGVCVGDSGFAANAEYRGFATFDSSAVPASIELLSAELRVGVRNIFGAPFPELGDLLIDQVPFATIGPGLFANPDAVTVGSLRSPIAAGTTISADLEAAILAPSGPRTQLRLRFSAGTDGDGVSDHIVAGSDTLELRVDYLTP